MTDRTETATVQPTETVTPMADSDQQALAAALDATQTPPPAPCTVGQVVAAYRRGLKGLCRGCLESGRLAYDLVHYRTYVTKTHTREAAVKAIEGQLADVAGRMVDVNSLIATWHAVAELHQNGDPLETPLPYSTLEEMRVAVERDSETDVWTLKPAMQEGFETLYVDACGNGSGPCMTLAKVGERVALIVARAKRAAAMELAEQAAKPESTDEEREAAAKALESAAKAEERAEKKAEQAKGNKAKGQKKSAAAKDREELPRMDKPGSAEDRGRMAGDFCCQGPDGKVAEDAEQALEEMLRHVKAAYQGELDSVAVRAVDAALVIFSRGAKAAEKAEKQTVAA